MSRGPGTAQMQVLEALAAYHRLGKELGWRWNVGGSFYRQYLADSGDIAAYERGQRVEIWMLRRDTGLSAPEVSRALRSLSRWRPAKGDDDGYVFVMLYGANADYLGLGFRAAKFASITNEGLRWLSAKKGQEPKLALSGEAAP